jgi:hypothetical protein
MNERQNKIEALILEVLSFYEPMSFELILLDMPEKQILEISNFNREDLEKTLKILIKKKRIKVSSSKSDKEVFWIKVIPKKGLLRRISSLFSSNKPRNR